MNLLLAFAVGGVMLIVIGRELFGRMKDVQRLDARNRRVALLTFTLIMVAFIATVIIVHSVRAELRAR